MKSFSLPRNPPIFTEMHSICTGLAFIDKRQLANDRDGGLRALDVIPIGIHGRPPRHPTKAVFRADINNCDYSR
jgi:hypothetical protein